MAVAAARRAWGSERTRVPAGRRRLRAVGVLRFRHPHTDLRPPRRRRRALSRLPHDGDLFADAGMPADGTQSPLQRCRDHPGNGHRLPRLQRHGAEGERLPLRDAARAGLCDAGHRQVAPHACQRVRVRRVEGAVATLARVRAFLRLHRRQDQPVGADAGARQPLHRPAEDTGGGLPPQRRPGGPRHRIPHRSAYRRAAEALLHVLLPGGRTCAASRRARVDRALSRPVRPGLGPLARGGVSRGSSNSASCRRIRDCRRGHSGSRRGTRSRRMRGDCTRGKWRSTPPFSNRPIITSVASSSLSRSWASSTTRSS